MFPGKLPVVLSKQTVVGVSQVDRVAGGPQTLRHERRVHAGILEVVSREVVDGCEDQVEDLRSLGAVDAGALTVPAELQHVRRPVPRETQPEGGRLLLQAASRKARPDEFPA